LFASTTAQVSREITLLLLLEVTIRQLNGSSPIFETDELFAFISNHMPALKREAIL
jgi:hypothetical protein